MTATFGVALYGALLSTVLALAKLIPEWPIISVGPVEMPGVDRATTVSVHILNPAKRPLFICGSIQLPPWKKRFSIIEQRPLKQTEEIARAFMRPGLPVYVPAAGAASLMISKIEAEQTRRIVFGWHRNWLLRWLQLPASVRVSSSLAATMNRVSP